MRSIFFDLLLFIILKAFELYVFHTLILFQLFNKKYWINYFEHLKLRKDLYYLYRRWIVEFNEWAVILFIYSKLWFFDYNSGNLKKIININVILAFTSNRPRIINLEHSAVSIILDNFVNAKRRETHSLW